MHGSTGTTRTIAVIDDDQSVRDLMHDLLTEEGYHVQSYPFSAALATQLRDLQPHLIIQDIHIGNDEPSWTLLDQLQGHPSTAHIKIMVSSTNPSILEAHADYLHEHVIPCVEKPFSFDVLLDLITTLLGERSG